MLKRRIYQKFVDVKRFFVKKNRMKYMGKLLFSKTPICSSIDKEVSANLNFVDSFIYKDQTWNVVLNRFSDRFRKFYYIPIFTDNNYCFNNKVQCSSNTITFNSNSLEDDWIYMYSSIKSLGNYKLSFHAKFDSYFREIQFGIRYIDFYNRYRFRIEEGYLHFDIVKDGQFYNSLKSEPFLINLSKTYSFKIIVNNNEYSFECDGDVIMTIHDEILLFNDGSFAFILWDDSGNSNIKAHYSDISLIPIN
jgi:hypothetical protein